jgi:hypothetical protein
MSFKRVILPEKFFTGDELTRAMAGIGMRVSTSSPLKNPNIEDVLLSASLEGLNKNWRTLSLVVDWFQKHSSIINVDRLTRALIELKDNKLLMAFWSALAKTTGHDLRFKRMRGFYKGKPIVLGGPSAELLLKRNGEDERFQKSGLLVPNNLLRVRANDIQDIKELVQLHLGVYYRVLIGPTYRADCFANFEMKNVSTPSDAARTTYSAFKTAWDAIQDWAKLSIQ